MDTRIDTENGTMRVMMRGELDHHAARDHNARLREQIDYHLPLRCLLDLGGLTFMDSSGLAVILYVFNRMEELGGALELQNTPPQAARVISASGVDRLISMRSGDVRHEK